MYSNNEPSYFPSLSNTQATVVCISSLVSLFVLSITLSPSSKQHRSHQKASTQTKKEQTAKESFRVRKSNLLAVSGRAANRKRNKHKQWRSNNTCFETNAMVQHRSWIDEILLSFKETASYVVNAFTRLFYKGDYSTSENTPWKATHSSQMPKIDMETYYDNVKVVGVDCEMVGGGKGGMNSLLARCSVVTLDLPGKRSDTSNHSQVGANNIESNNIHQNLIILYDKYVIPKGRITDYRTQWSGITKETYVDSNAHSIPIVTFYQCQKEITELFSSIDGKSVLVVGHALENDFDALEIKHPAPLTRDTAFYRPYMREVRRRLFPRKLSALASEELGIEIQQEPHLVEHNATMNPSTLGHSSVEDAAAALRLYWHRYQDWERSLRYPLRLPTSAGTVSGVTRGTPIKCFYLDCCNLPLGLRGVDFKELLTRKDKTQDNLDKVVSSKSVRLISRHRSMGNSPTIATTDWIPYFRSLLLPGTYPQIESFVVMFDGAKFRDITKNQSASRGSGRYSTNRFYLESRKDHGSIAIEITEDGDSADDVLFHHCCDIKAEPVPGKNISLHQAADIFSNTRNDNNQLDSYIVIRRKAGGSKSHRRLFDKLHLRRANEGALCLSGLTSNLHKDSWRTVRELQRERGVEKVIECELRRRDEIVNVVVTDDVFLTERLVQLGTVLVLSYRQMEDMF